jgi:hypothetical protein
VEPRKQGGLHQIDPVNEILFFYDSRIGPLDLFVYGRLLELIREFGEKEVLGALRSAASERRTGEAVLKWAEDRLTDRMKGRIGESESHTYLRALGGNGKVSGDRNQPQKERRI